MVLRVTLSSMVVGFGMGTAFPLLLVLAIDHLHQILGLATRKGRLHIILGHGAMVRTSLYADDVEVFVAPIKRDIDNLTSILRGFSEVTGLCMNF